MKLLISFVVSILVALAAVPFTGRSAWMVGLICLILLRGLLR